MDSTIDPKRAVPGRRKAEVRTESPPEGTKSVLDPELERWLRTAKVERSHADRESRGVFVGTCLERSSQEKEQQTHGQEQPPARRKRQNWMWISSDALPFELLPLTEQERYQSCPRPEQRWICERLHQRQLRMSAV